MELLQHLFVLAHLLGMAAVIGSAVFVARGTVTPALVWGARAQLITGLVLVGLAQGAVGFVQYFTDLPIVLVGFHLLGAALVAASMTWSLLATRPRAERVA